MQFEADDCGRNVVIFSELQLVFVDRIDGEDIVMRFVALRRARAAVAVGDHIFDDGMACRTQSRPQESEQDDKWSFCLTAGTLCPANQER
jgi:hypothetical protein